MDQGNICRNLFNRNFTPDGSASATNAFNMNLNTLNILRKDCWNNTKTFLQHYEMEIICYEEIDFNKIMEY